MTPSARGSLGLGLLAVWRDALEALRTRRASAAACGIAAALAVGVFVATGVLSSSDRLAVERTFLTLDRPVITLRGAAAGSQMDRGIMRLRSDDIRRIASTSGTTAVGRLADIGTGVVTSAARRRPAQVVAADPGGIAASAMPFIEGRPPRPGPGAGAHAEVVLGVALARDLAVPSLALAPVVRLYGRTWNVVGVVDSGDARPDGARIAIVPWSMARHRTRERTVALIRTVPGYQHEIAPRSPAIALPDAPSEIVGELPAAPVGLRRAVAESVAQAATAVAAVTLVGGLMALFQTTSVSVFRRTREIGLRRALGATRRIIATQIELEVLAIGAVGSILGAAIGGCAGALVAHLNDWPLVVPITHTLGGIGAGVSASLLAGVVPAWRASVIDPAAALRTE